MPRAAYLGLSSRLTAFEQGEISFLPYLLGNGTSTVALSSEGPLPLFQLSAFCDNQGVLRTYSYPNHDDTIVLNVNLGHILSNYLAFELVPVYLSSVNVSCICKKSFVLGKCTSK